MSFSLDQIKALSGPLDRNVVKERNQAGRQLSYIEAWHAIAEANRIFGFDAWDRETVTLTETNRDLVEVTDRNGVVKPQWRVGYLAKVRINVRTAPTDNGFDGAVVTRSGTGFGSGMAKPEALGEAIESAIKEAESDAMKRALMTFGNPFGLALYDKTQANVVDIPEPVVTQAQVDTLEALIQDVGADRARFLGYLRIKSLSDLKAADYDGAVEALEAKRAK